MPDIFQTLEQQVDESDANYVMNRLRYTRRLNLPASVQFDLARSSMSPSELKALGTQFGYQNDVGFGITNTLDHLMTSQPDKVPVADLRTYQENLQKRGYAPKWMTPDGNWSTEWSSASYLFEQDNREQQYSGDNFAATTVKAGMEMLTNTMPTKLWQSIIGGAKGVVEQAGETAGRVGALGGLAAGAAIGTAITPGAGTIVGGLVGAGIGFVTDLFGKQEDDPEVQNGVSKVIDALSPFEEYSSDAGGLKAFWEDVGFTLTAAGLISGGAAAARGVLGLPGAIGEAQAGLAAADSPATVSRAIMSLGSEDRTFLSFLGRHSKPLGEFLAREPLSLARAYSRGITELAKPVVTGLTGAGIGARYFGGLGQGGAGAFRDALEAEEANRGRPLTEEEIVDLKVQVATTSGSTIEQAIAKTPELQTINAPMIGDLADLPSLFFVPEHLFPWKLGELGEAASKAIGESTLSPIAAVVRHHYFGQGKSISAGDSLEKARSFLGDNDVEQGIAMKYLYYSAGLDVMTEHLAKIKSSSFALKEAAPEVEGLKMSIRSDLYNQLREGTLDIKDVLAGVTGKNQNLMTMWLLRETAGGKDLERLKDYVVAMKEASAATSDIRSGVLKVGDDASKMLTSTHTAINKMKMQSEVNNAVSQAKRYREEALVETDPARRAELFGLARGRDAYAESVRQLIPKEKALVDTPTVASISIARNETPTSSQWIEQASQAKVLLNTYNEARKAARGISDINHPLVQAELNTRQAWDEFVTTAWEQYGLPSEVIENALGEKPGKRLIDYMRGKAKYAAADADFLPPDVTARINALGYKPVLTSTELFGLDDVTRMADAMGGPQYTHLQRIVDSLGISPALRTDRAYVRMLNEGQKSSIGRVLDTHGINVNLDDVYRRLIKETRQEGRMKTILGAKFGRVAVPDVARLSPERVEKALDGIPGMDATVAKDVFRAAQMPYGGEVQLLHPLDSMRLVGHAIRANGLPGFADAIRSWHIPDPGRYRRNLVYSVAGAATLGVGENLVDDKEGLDLKPFLFGGLAGLGVSTLAFARKGYGYLPRRLADIHNALRFTLSPTFDGGRYVEQNALAAAEEGLEPMLKPKAHILARPGRTPFSVDASGEQLWQDTLTYWERLTGGVIKEADDLERRMSASGVLGFTPQEFEAAQAMQLWRKWTAQKKIFKDEDVFKAVMRFGRYGEGRTGLERSANFVFFPLSYSKKLALAAGDFMLQEPARRLVLYELMSRYYQSGASDDVNTWMEDHLPILNNINRISNFGAYGLSPGRFLLKGLKEKTAFGKAIQLLTSAVVPGGAAQPLADTVGKVGDRAMMMFMPVTLTKEQLRSQNVIDDIMGSYIPAIRDLSLMFDDARNQVRALMQGESLDAQINDYMRETSALEANLEPIAAAYGHSSVSSLLASNDGAAFKMALQEQKDALADKYPAALPALEAFDSHDLTDQKALRDLADKVKPTPSERALLSVSQIEGLRTVFTDHGIASDLARQIVSGMMREEAMKHAGDPTFVGLWDRFYAKTYGPLLVTR